LAAGFSRFEADLGDDVRFDEREREARSCAVWVEVAVPDEAFAGDSFRLFE
jgi:hypothetical protein